MTLPLKLQQLYSMSFCNEQDPVEVNQDLLRLVEQILCLNEPINAKPRGILFQPTFCESIPTCQGEELEFQIYTRGAYDIPLQYDTDVKYDTNLVTESLTIQQDCPPTIGCGEFDENEFNDDFSTETCN